MSGTHREMTGLLVNVQCDHVPHEFNMGSGMIIKLTREFEVDEMYLMFAVGQEEYMQIVDWGRESMYALVAPLEAPTHVTAVTDPAFVSARDSLRDIVTAIRIIKTPWVGTPLMWVGDRVLRSGWDIASDYIWGGPRPCRIGKKDLHDIQDLLRQIAVCRAQSEDEERRRLGTAIDRLNSAIDRGRTEDKIVDLFIAIEALFHNEDEWVRVGRCVHRRVSEYVGREHDIETWYSIRSRIVHGGHIDADLTPVTEGLTRVVRRALRKAMAAPSSLSEIRALRCD